MTAAVVRQFRAEEAEVVEIRWTLRDGSFFYQRVTVPKPAARGVIASQVNQSDQALAAPTDRVLRSGS